MKKLGFITKKLLSWFCALAMVPVFAPVTNAANTLVAFPGAEGAGKYATGGRGGKVYHVTNLNDSGAGSFRDAVGSSNRIVVFDVGGTITLKSDVVVKGNVTILGQTAPGGAGITLSGCKLGMGGDNIIIRYLSSRPGERGSGEYDAWGGSNGSNSIIDHCSIGWANDEQWGLYSNNMNQTVQYTIVGPSNCVSTHAKGAHGFGVMFGKGQNSWHHNMIAHNISRNFRGKVEKTNTMDFVNNVIYDWGYQTGYGTLGHMNYVGNYLKAGPSTGGGYHFMKADGSNRNLYKFYLTGNKVVKPDGSSYNQAMNDNNWSGGIQFCDDGNGYTFTEKDYRSDTPFEVKDVNGGNSSIMTGKVETAEEAFETVLSYAGAGISAEQRPQIDREVMEEARTGTGSLTGGRDFSQATSEQKTAIEKYNIKQVDYDSYYPAYVSKTITDTDGDGMSDDWELARGLDINKDDSAGDYLGQGYMNIEYYANDLTIKSFPDGVVTESPASVDLGPEYTQIKEELEALKLSTTAIKTASELSLPQKGEKYGLDISWSSSSSAIKLSNNQISSVNRKADEQNVTLTANISYAGYNMSKTFNVTVISNNTFWRAKGDVSANSELFEGLTVLYDGTYKAAANDIGGESFSGYLTSVVSGAFENGAGSGTAFKFTAQKDGFLTAYAVKVGTAEKAKTLYITEEGTADYKTQSEVSKDGFASNISVTASVKTGKTYYIYVAGSKAQFAGIEFSQTAKPIWWKASVSGVLDQSLADGLYPFSAMAYSEGAKDIDGESFTGWISGTENGSYKNSTASGSGLRYTPEKNGDMTVYFKINNGKTYTVKDTSENVVSSYTNDEGVNSYSSFTTSVKGGETYYIYIDGSKGAFYGMSFTETAAADEPENTPTPSPASTANPTGEPISTASPKPTALPSETVSPSSTPVSGKIKVEKVIRQGNMISYEAENAEEVTLDTYIASYSDDGRLTSVIKSSNVVKNGKVSFECNNITENAKVFVWRNMEAVYAPCILYTE